MIRYLKLANKICEQLFTNEIKRKHKQTSNQKRFQRENIEEHQSDGELNGGRKKKRAENVF